MKDIKEDTNKWRNILNVFMDWKNQYCENDYTNQSNL